MTSDTPRTTVRAALSLTSDEHSPATITAAVGLMPTSTLVKGEPRRPGRPPSALNVWSLARPEVGTDFVEQEVAALVDELATAGDALPRAIARLALTAYVSCVVWIGQDTPALAFEPALLRRIADLGAGLDVDLYLRTVEG